MHARVYLKTAYTETMPHAVFLFWTICTPIDECKTAINIVSYNKMPLITHYNHLVTNTNKSRGYICTLNLIYFNLGENFIAKCQQNYGQMCLCT